MNRTITRRLVSELNISLEQELHSLHPNLSRMLIGQRTSKLVPLIMAHPAIAHLPSVIILSSVVRSRERFNAYHLEESRQTVVTAVAKLVSSQMKEGVEFKLAWASLLRLAPFWAYDFTHPEDAWKEIHALVMSGEPNREFRWEDYRAASIEARSYQEYLDAKYWMCSILEPERVIDDVVLQARSSF